MTDRLLVCTDPPDLASVRWLLSQTDVDAGWLALHPSGHAVDAGAAALMTELLDAAGITGTQRRVGRAHENVLLHVLPWLHAYGIRNLLVHGSARVPADAVALLLEACSAAGIRVWLTSASRSPERQALLHDAGASFLSWASFEPQLRYERALATRQVTPPVEPVVALPPMPSDDFLTFRAAMRDSLTSEQFDHADELYRSSLAEAHQSLAPLLAGEGTTAAAAPAPVGTVGRPLLDRALLEAAVAQYLHAVLQRSSTLAEMTVRVRAAQAAAFHLGWLLQVNLERLTATAQTPSAAVRANPATWRTFRLYREPYAGAVLALVALGLDIETLLALAAEDVADDGSTVTAHGHRLHVPTEASVLLRAQLISGQLEGRPPTAPFLHANGARLTEHKVVTVVRAALLDTGVPLLSRLVDHTWNGFEWMARWGVCLQDIA